MSMIHLEKDHGKDLSVIDHTRRITTLGYFLERPMIDHENDHDWELLKFHKFIIFDMVFTHWTPTHVGSRLE